MKTRLILALLMFLLLAVGVNAQMPVRNPAWAHVNPPFEGAEAIYSSATVQAFNYYGSYWLEVIAGGGSNWEQDNNYRGGGIALEPITVNDGLPILIQDVGLTHYLAFSHDGTDANIEADAGSFDFFTTGLGNGLRVHALGGAPPGGAFYIGLRHDATDGFLESLTGDLVLDAASNLIYTVDAVTIDDTATVFIMSLVDNAGAGLDGVINHVAANIAASETYRWPVDGNASDLLQTDGAGNFSWTAPVAAYTDEQAQDAVGTIWVDTTTVDFTYTDLTPEMKADAITQMSITSDASGLKLSGDATSPGNLYRYGTNNAGAKGYYVAYAGITNESQYMDTLAATTNGGVHGVTAIANSTHIDLTAQPYARRYDITILPVAETVTCTFTWNGVDADGTTRADALAINTAVPATYTTNYAFTTLTSVVITGYGGGGLSQWDADSTDQLGYKNYPWGATTDVFYILRNGAVVTPAGLIISATYGTIDFAPIVNGDDIFVMYRPYKVGV